MINKPWIVSSQSKIENINVLAQYNRLDKGKNLDVSTMVMGFYFNGWNTVKAIVTETEAYATAAVENLSMNAGEQYLLIGNPAEIRKTPEPEPIVPIKEIVTESHSETSFNVIIRPNPFIAQTRIIINSHENEKTIKIYDATGKLMLTETLEGKGSQSIIVGKDFPTGVYTAVITTGNSRKTLRFIKR